MLPVHYFGMALGGGAIELALGRPATTKASAPPPSTAAMFAFGTGHYTAQLLMIVAICVAGSATFQLTYSISPATTAALSYLLLGKTVTKGQIASIIMIIVGLMNTARRPESSSSSGGSSAAAPDDGFFRGVLITLASALCFNIVNISTGRAFQQNPDISPGWFLRNEATCAFVVALSVVAAWTGPRWQELVVQPMQEAQVAAGNAGVDGYGLFLIALPVCVAYAFSVGALNFAWFRIAKQESGVMLLSVLQGANTLFVILASHGIYCSEAQPDRCLSSSIAISALLIVCGVIGYGTMAATPAVAKSSGSGGKNDKASAMRAEKMRQSDGTPVRRSARLSGKKKAD